MNNMLVNVGEQDRWDPADCVDYVAIDSTMRLAGVLAPPSEPYYRGVGGSKRITPRSGLDVYAEAVVTGNVPTNTTRWAFGVIKDGASLVAIGAAGANAVVFTTNGSIYKNGALNQSGLGTVSTGSRVGLRVYTSSGTDYVQFSVDGVNKGTAVALDVDTYRLVHVSASNGGQAALLCADGDDQFYRPTGSRPWGASIRAALQGVYTPASSKLTNFNGNVTIQRDRVAKRTNFNGRTAFANNAVSGSALRYFEADVILAATSTATCRIGLCTDAHSVGSYLGNTTVSWAYTQNGSTYYNSTLTATGITYTTGDVVGVVYDPTTGNLWFAKNGVVLSGDPEAGTGAHYTTTGTVYPALCPGDGVCHLRLSTHAAEQRYRPAYAVAWDGGDAMPEQHWRGVLNPGTEVVQSLGNELLATSYSSTSNVELRNEDARYDDADQWVLRNELVQFCELVGSDLVASEVSNWSSALVDAVFLEGFKRLKLTCRGRELIMDERSDSNAYLLGIAGYAQAVGSGTTTEHGYQLAQDAFNLMTETFDSGVAVTSVGAGRESTAGFVRTVAPNGRHAVRSAIRYAQTSEALVTNGDFTSWSGDNPTSWTVTETAPDIITQNGNACRFVRGAAGATVAMTHATATATFVRFTVSAYTKGDLRIGSRRAGITGTGTYVVYRNGAVQFSAELDTDLTIDNVYAIGATAASTADKVFDELFADAGWDSDAWTCERSLNVWSLGYQTVERPTYLRMLQEICDGLFWSYYVDENNILRLIPIVAPAGSAVLDIEQHQIIGEIDAQDVLAAALSDRVNDNTANFNIHDVEDILPGASASTRQLLLNVGTDLTAITYDAFYAHAVGAPARRNPTLSDGITAYKVKNRLADFFGVRRRKYTLVVDNALVRDVRLGKEVSITHVRCGLSVGKDTILVEKRRRVGSPTTIISVIG